MMETFRAERKNIRQDYPGSLFLPKGADEKHAKAFKSTDSTNPTNSIDSIDSIDPTDSTEL
jgi:hypothetical protein